MKMEYPPTRNLAGGTPFSAELFLLKQVVGHPIVL
jgi:hypothetical protein